MNTYRCMRIVTVVLLVAWVLLVASAPLAMAEDPPPEGGDEGGDQGRGGEIVAAIRRIATVVIDIAIGIAVILMAVGIATGFVGGQFLVTVGQPYGLSTAWVRVISVVMLGIGALLTITIVNTVINAVAGLVPATEIPSI
jgi:hypothetical protein